MKDSRVPAIIVMVLMRATLLAWMGVVPVAWCLSLEGAQPPYLRLSPHDLSNDDLRPHHLTPNDLSQDDLQSLLPRQVKEKPDAASLSSYDDNDVLRELEDPNSPVAYRLQQALSEVAGGPGAAMDAGASSPAGAPAGEGAAGDNWLPVDPRYYLLTEYLTRDDQAGTNLGSTLDSIRKARNSRNSSSSNSSFDNTNMAKRAWPHGLSRRRNSGLSLSIDASMKVLREALYLEIARKKQRQQMQRAQHNKALLNSIGKRDVSHQLQENRPEGVQQWGQRN
ncbi:uncharacterized protein Dh44 isoform X1 [Panulirus ornatus]|uniref:uncharacterized protein Dh44 isoform X1 n=2 Tax=Panulirus ornatus TaxID=150431 RepID=UPI003A889A73